MSEDWSLEVADDRFHVRWLQAVGALRILAHQGFPDTRLELAMPGIYGLGEWRFHGFPLALAESFFRETYSPSHVYSPWNARSFGTGFSKHLARARKIPQLAGYCATVDGAARSDKPVGKDKDAFLIDLLTGKLRLSEAHTRWARACWRLEVPERKSGKGRAPAPKVHARPIMGSGGCEGSQDFGSLFLEAAVDHFHGAGPGRYALGSFAFPDQCTTVSPQMVGREWNERDPLMVMLLLEGAISLAYPHEGVFCAEMAETMGYVPGSEADCWHEKTRLPRGRYHLPIWEGALAWDQVRDLLAGSWARPPVGGHPGQVAGVVNRLHPIAWRESKRYMRAHADTLNGAMWTEAKRLHMVHLHVVRSPEERLWVVDYHCDGERIYHTTVDEDEGWFSTTEDVVADARRVANAEWPGAVVTVEVVELEMVED